MRQTQAVLFDLDGTLADTAPDLADAFNQVLQEQGYPCLPFEAIRPHVSHGSTALLRQGIPFEPETSEFNAIRQRFLTLYQQNISRRTALFPGMAELLDHLDSIKMPWGIVTNKPSWLTNPLVHDLNLAQRAACVVSGDTTSQSKPHPEPILYACRQLNCDATEAVYVGDAERDIEAGRRAGTLTLVALFGYLSVDDQPDCWKADGLINHPNEIVSWLAP